MPAFSFEQISPKPTGSNVKNVKRPDRHPLVMRIIVSVSLITLMIGAIAHFAK